MDLLNLKRNPHLLHSIIGVKDGRRIIKGFIRGGDKDEKKIKARLKRLFPPCTQIALFNIDKQSESISDEAKMIQSEEENSPDLDESTKIRLDKVIEKSQNHLYKTSSNIIGIGISNVRYDGNAFLKEPCIVLYCLDKHIVPLGERPLPIHIEGWPCDHRENIALRKHFFLFDKLLSDHNFVVKSWKRKDMPNTTILEMNPSIQDYIAGDKGDKRVIKAFMIGGDAEEKEVEDDLNKACILTKGISIEIVNIDKQSESFRNEVEKLKWEEDNSPDLDESTRTQLEKVIEKHQKYLYTRFSNIIAIGKSNVRCDGKIFVYEPCIVLYCLDKNIIPFGERSLPTIIEKWPCDHREDFVMLEKCPSKCPSPNFLELGCSIGPDFEKITGSAGFMVQSQNNSTTGFLTAAHVAVKKLDEKKLHLPSVKLTENIEINHPSYADDKIKKRGIGTVKEAYYGDYNGRFLDVAYVVDYFKRESMIFFFLFKKFIFIQQLITQNRWDN